MDVHVFLLFVLYLKVVIFMQVLNLFEGADYLFRVFAENKVGPSLKPAELEVPIRAKMPYGKSNMNKEYKQKRNKKTTTTTKTNNCI